MRSGSWLNCWAQMQFWSVGAQGILAMAWFRHLAWGILSVSYVRVWRSWDADDWGLTPQELKGLVSTWAATAAARTKQTARGLRTMARGQC